MPRLQAPKAHTENARGTESSCKDYGSCGTARLFCFLGQRSATGSTVTMQEERFDQIIGGYADRARHYLIYRSVW